MKKISLLLYIVIIVFLFIGWNKMVNYNYDYKSFNKENEYKLIMINGDLYYNTERESTNIPRCGTMDGEITSTVNKDKIPKENGQSNFGKGYGYQICEDGQIELYIDNKWIVFERVQFNKICFNR